MEQQRPDSPSTREEDVEYAMPSGSFLGNYLLTFRSPRLVPVLRLLDHIQPQHLKLAVP